MDYLRIFNSFYPRDHCQYCYAGFELLSYIFEGEVWMIELNSKTEIRKSKQILNIKSQYLKHLNFEFIICLDFRY